MQDTDWDDLRYFLAVSRQGSLSRAAKHLNVNHSTVLRRLGSLEERLGVRLFDRLASGYVMTQAGEELRDRLEGVQDSIEAAQRQLLGLDLALSGTIRVTSTDTLMRGLLFPCLAAFRALHPHIQLQVVVNNVFLSLNKREADVANRPTNKPAENLVGRKLGRIRSAVYASKTYLKKNAKKANWSEHDWVGPDDSLAHLAQAKWMGRHVPAERIAIRVDSLLGMVEAVKHGMGMGLLLCMLADDEKDLLRVAEPLEELDTEVWILTHPDLRHTARIKAFNDFVYQSLAASSKIVTASSAGRRRSSTSRRPAA
jgi:DNA-binding transcriptional LysR family regulator